MKKRQQRYIPGGSSVGLSDIKVGEHAFFVIEDGKPLYICTNYPEGIRTYIEEDKRLGMLYDGLADTICKRAFFSSQMRDSCEGISFCLSFSERVRIKRGTSLASCFKETDESADDGDKFPFDSYSLLDAIDRWNDMHSLWGRGNKL